MLRSRFKYIFIDEFQDTTPTGIELLRGIFDSEDNVLQNDWRSLSNNYVWTTHA